MSDSYQPIYDAVRSRIHGCDIGGVVEAVVREAFSMADYRMASIADVYAATAYEQQLPSVLFRPALSIDGNQWCALYGENLQEGVAGFGDTPALAMQDFDKQWNGCAARKQGANHDNS